MRIVSWKLQEDVYFYRKTPAFSHFKTFQKKLADASILFERISWNIDILK